MIQFKNPSLNSNKMYVKTLSGFKGVDYSNSVINVAENRATDMRNFLYRDGNIHKRYGFEEMLNFPDKINGMWQFVTFLGENGEKTVHTIVHSGNNIYRAYINENIAESYYELVNFGFTDFQENYSVGLGEIKNQKSYGIIRNDRLYIFCGTLIVYGYFNGNWEIRHVRDEDDTYIPIVRTNLKSDGSYSTLDEINLLSSRRKVKIIGENTVESFKGLDVLYNNSSVVENETEFANTYNKGIYAELTGQYTHIELSFETDDGTYVSRLLRLSNEDRTYTLSTFLNETGGSGIDVFETFISALRVKIVHTINGINLTVIYGFRTAVRTTVTKIWNKRESSYNLSVSSLYPDIPVTVKNIETDSIINSEYYTVNYETATITFNNIDLTPSLIGNPNVEVTFVPREYINNRKWEWIEQCTFGEILTLNEIDTLFVSGNPNMPNYDFHTSITFSEQQGELTTYENLTYWGELGYAKLGSSDTKITGYSLLEDGVLGIHKEFSNNESNFYVRSAEISNATDLSGLPIYLQDGTTQAKTVIFPQFASAIGEGCVSPFSTKNLLGDKLMASMNGIFGIELSSNIKTNERYSKQRSKIIDARLTKEELINCNAVVYDGKYFLYVGGEEEKVYVADSRYKNYNDNDLRDTFSYEWFVLNGIDAQIWYVDVNYNLWFGTKNGKLCKFVKESFSDITYNSIEFSVNDDSTINLTEGLYKNDDVLLFSTGTNLHQIVIEADYINHTENSDLYLVNDPDFYLDRFRYYYEKDVIVIDNDDVKHNLFIEDDLNEEYGFKLVDKSTKNYYNGSIKAIVKQIIINKILLKNDNIYLKGVSTDLEGNYNYLIIDTKYLVPQNNKTFVKFDKGVLSYWYTPVMYLGSIDYKKTIYYITTLFEPVINGKVNIGYKTRITNNDTIDVDNYTIQGIDVYNYWNDLTFDNFSVELSNITKSYSEKHKIKNFNCIQFFFVSDNDKDCVINAINLNYTITKRAKGVN